MHFFLIFWTPSSASTAFKCIFETFLDIKGYWVLRLYDYLDQNWSMVIKMAWSIEIRLPRQLLQQNCYGTFFGPSCSGATKIENNKLQVNRNPCLVCGRIFRGTILWVSFCSLSFHRVHLDYCVVFLWYFCICVSFFISARKYFPFCPPVTTAPIIHSTFLHLIPLTVCSHPVQSFSHFLCSLSFFNTKM